MGQNGYYSYDENERKQDIDFVQYKFFFNKIQEKTPTHLSWMEAYTLWLVCSGHVELCEKGYLEKLMEYGYLKKEEGIIPNLVIFDRDAEKPCNESLAAKLASLRDEIAC